jgi:sulfide dehydrogenase [flavocytochrome c] flavoprotein subunit
MPGISRRHFLSLGLGCGGLLLGACKDTPGKASDLSKARVIVAGGGFAGMNAARALKRISPELQVTLIERYPIYMCCPGSNRVIAGMASIDSLAHDIGTGPEKMGIQVMIGTITGINGDRKHITLADGSSLPFDRLIMAPGMDLRWDAIEGYDEAASTLIPHAWKAGEQTLLLRRQIRSLRRGGTVVITVPDNPYRCPPGPYERASLMAHYLKTHNPRAKILILDAKTRFSKQRAFSHAWKTLYPGMVEWVSSEHEGQIDHIDTRHRVVNTEFNKHPADVLNVIPPQRAGKLVTLADLQDETGWCPVDPLSFESTKIPGIHIIGDACIATPMPKSAFSAQSQARACASAVVELLSGQVPTPPRLINHCFSFVDAERAISVTGVYGYQPSTRALEMLSSGETAPDDDWAQEGIYATDGYELMIQETFGQESSSHIGPGAKEKTRQRFAGPSRESYLHPAKAWSSNSWTG